MKTYKVIWKILTAEDFNIFSEVTNLDALAAEINEDMFDKFFDDGKVDRLKTIVEHKPTIPLDIEIPKVDGERIQYDRADEAWFINLSEAH